MKVQMFTYEGGTGVAFDKVLDVKTAGRVQAVCAAGLTFIGDVGVINGPSIFPAPDSKVDQALICEVKPLTKRHPLENGIENSGPEITFDLPSVDLENDDPKALNAILVARFGIRVAQDGQIVFTPASTSYRLFFVNFAVTSAGSIHDAFRRSGGKGSIWATWLSPNRDDRKLWKPKR